MQNAEIKAPRKQRRPRTIQACNFCREKKYKCDGSLPCSNCRRLQKSCAFSGAPDADVANISISYVRQLERKLEASEVRLRALEQQATVLQPKQEERPSQATPPSSADSERKTPESGTSEQQTDHEPLSEIMEINTTTKRFEFHGASSIITVLDRLVHLRNDLVQTGSFGANVVASHTGSAVSEYQNDEFMLSSRGQQMLLPMTFSDEYFSSCAPVFIEAYFSGVHYLHPLIDARFFWKRCHDLWTGNTYKMRASFLMLYYGVLALGASTRTWNEPSIDGHGRSEWTQLLFGKAQQAMAETEYDFDFEGAQALFILSQICLHQLNYNLAFSYIGSAVRIAQSSALHRQMKQEESRVPIDSPTWVIARTWWTLYAMDIEMCLLLGRPSCLGNHTHYTRQLPPIRAGAEANIISCMYGLAQAQRAISCDIYAGILDHAAKLKRASEIERALDDWHTDVPKHINIPAVFDSPVAPLQGNEVWTAQQLVLLRIRFYHAKVLLFYPFFIRLDQTQNPSAAHVDAASRCLEASRALIREVFTAYKSFLFQRTWSFFSTYLSRALAVMLTHVARLPPAERQIAQDRDFLIQALHVLDALDEENVTRKIANLTRDLLALLSMPTEVRIESTKAPHRFRWPRWEDMSNFKGRGGTPDGQAVTDAGGLGDFPPPPGPFPPGQHGEFQPGRCPPGQHGDFGPPPHHGEGFPPHPPPDGFPPPPHHEGFPHPPPDGFGPPHHGMPSQHQGFVQSEMPSEMPPLGFQEFTLPLRGDLQFQSQSWNAP